MLNFLLATQHDISKPQLAIVLKVETSKPVEYIVKENDNLSKIADAQNTNIERLWEKNTQLENPDLIKPGDKLVIPKPDEPLADRPMPERIVIETTPSPSLVAIPKTGVHKNVGATRNMYSAGYCTAYAWSRRPDLPGNLGNADSWGIRAAQQGFVVNDAPAPGAIGVAVGYTHVVYVEQVDGARVLVSEQNYEGFGIVSSRWTSASEFRYIH